MKSELTTKDTGRWLVRTKHSDYEIDMDHKLFLRLRRDEQASRIFNWDKEDDEVLEARMLPLVGIYCEVGNSMQITNSSLGYMRSTIVESITKADS